MKPGENEHVESVDTTNRETASQQSRELAETHYENFPLATWLLPSDLQTDLKHLYAYARTVDDIGDEAEGNRTKRLDEWEADFHRCYEGTPEHPVLVALQETIRKHDLPPDPFLNLIEANRRDQQQSQYETMDDLLDYCRYSANPCGRLYLMVCGYNDESLFELSDQTCSALQLTNFWQDVGIDLEKGRIYIPRQRLAAYDITPDDLREWQQTEQSPLRFRDMMDELVRETNDLFAGGLELVHHVHNRLKFDLLLFTLGGNALLNRLQDQSYPVFEKRVKLTGFPRLMIFPRAFWTWVTGGVDSLKEKL